MLKGTHHTKATKKKCRFNLIGKTGCKARNWKGGIRKFKGYIFIYSPFHPFCDTHKYVREHRLVIEKIIRRYLKPREKCHHLGKKDDNKPFMLMAFAAFANHSAHKRFERGGIVKFKEIIYDGRKHPRET